MSIILVGGHDRMYNEYQKICKNAGHRIKIYTQMPAKFCKVIGSPDAMIIFTNTVSHKMVKTANNEAKRKQIPIIRCHSSSKSALLDVLNTLENC